MGFGSLDFTLPGRRSGHQGPEQGGGSPSYFVDGPIERSLVCSRWFDKPGDLPYKLQGSHPDLLAGCRKLEIIQSLDIPTHFTHLASSDRTRPQRARGIITPTRHTG